MILNVMISEIRRNQQFSTSSIDAHFRRPQRNPDSINFRSAGVRELATTMRQRAGVKTTRPCRRMVSGEQNEGSEKSIRNVPLRKRNTSPEPPYIQWPRAARNAFISVNIRR